MIDLADELQQIARTCLYDDTNNRPLPGYTELLSIARALAVYPSQDMVRLRVASEMIDVIGSRGTDYCNGWRDAASFVRDSVLDECELSA